MEKTWCFFLNYLQKRRRHYLNKALLHPETQAVEKRLIEKKYYNLISLFTQLSNNSVSLLVKSPDNQTPYKLKETNTPSSSGLLHAGFSPPLLLTEQGGGTSVLRSRTAEGGRAGEIFSKVSIYRQSIFDIDISNRANHS